METHGLTAPGSPSGTDAHSAVNCGEQRQEGRVQTETARQASWGRWVGGGPRERVR